VLNELTGAPMAEDSDAARERTEIFDRNPEIGVLIEKLSDTVGSL